jgi:hypothetical protein
MFKDRLFYKVSNGIFNGPDIRKMMNCKDLVYKMTHIEKEAWEAYRRLIDNIFGKNKSENYKLLVKKCLSKFKTHGTTV